MSGISNQAWRQRALDRQREDEARINTMRQFVSQNSALSDANAKCVQRRTPPTLPAGNDAARRRGR